MRREKGERGEGEKAGAVAVSACHVKRNEPLSTLDNGSSKWAMTDSNRRLPRCKREGTPSEDATPQALTATPSAAWTAAWTSKPENANAVAPDAHQGNEGEGTDQGLAVDHLESLAAALLTLSPGDRERLAAMLKPL